MGADRGVDSMCRPRQQASALFDALPRVRVARRAGRGGSTTTALKSKTRPHAMVGGGPGASTAYVPLCEFLKSLTLRGLAVRWHCCWMVRYETVATRQATDGLALGSE